MKNFKKRTIALVLASVVTVVGAFGAENYKNSLMSLSFEGTSSGIDVTVHTKTNYAGSINPVKKDANTYVIMLPEVNSSMVSSPTLTGGVESVDVKTMPYTTSSKGYTKITVKTASNTMLSAKKALYIPEQNSSKPKEIETKEAVVNSPNSYETSRYKSSSEDYEHRVQRQNYPNTIHSRSGVDQTNPVDIKQSVKQFEPSQPSQVENKAKTNVTNSNTVGASDGFETLLTVLSVFLVLVLVIFFFIKAKNKMAEVLGEQADFNIDDEKVEKKKDSKKIRNTINRLDKMYAKHSFVQPSTSEYTKAVPISHEPSEDDEKENVIVDLDELFQEKISNEKKAIEVAEEENTALDEFLSAYTFDMGEAFQEEAENTFDEDLYEKFINNENLRFSKDDLERINSLLNSEINDDTIRNIAQFAPKTEVKEKRMSPTEILENLVTSYTISQNLTFSRDDVEALYKLIGVEIDNDFITDLKTNPERMKEMQKEIEEQKDKPRKPSELITLNVKDMLPDLSEALRKQNGKKIESEYKPEIVYYSDEGYEVKTLSLENGELPDLTIEINNKDAYKSRPSDEIEYAMSGYDVDKMSVSEEFYDIEDMLKNPEKYEKKKETVVVDEEALLKNIANVTFKPFYEGAIDVKAPNVEAIQAEFDKLDDNFEIVNENETTIQGSVEAQDDFASLFDNRYYDLDKDESKETKSNNRSDENAQQLLKLIEEQKEKRAQKELNKKIIEEIEEKGLPHEEQVEVEADTSTDVITDCVLGDEAFKIISNVKFNENVGCYLAKKNEKEYAVLGFVGSNVFKLKQYYNLLSEEIQSRICDEVTGGVSKYIVRVGAHKFMLNVSENNLELVMDLC